MITDAQLQAYAKELPDIYREILAAFPRIEPTRSQGYGLAFQTLAADFESRKLGLGLGEIIQACEQLGHHGLVEINTRLRADQALQHAFGRSACAEQSVVQETLDHATPANVTQLQHALTTIYRQQLYHSPNDRLKLIRDAHRKESREPLPFQLIYLTSGGSQFGGLWMKGSDPPFSVG